MAPCTSDHVFRICPMKIAHAAVCGVSRACFVAACNTLGKVSCILSCNNRSSPTMMATRPGVCYSACKMAAFALGSSETTSARSANGTTPSIPTTLILLKGADLVATEFFFVSIYK